MFFFKQFNATICTVCQQISDETQSSPDFLLAIYLFRLDLKRRRKISPSKARAERHLEARTSSKMKGECQCLVTDLYGSPWETDRVGKMCGAGWDTPDCMCRHHHGHACLLLQCRMNLYWTGSIAWSCSNSTSCTRVFARRW